MENEPTIESLREEIAAKDAALAEMKAAADAQHAEAEKLGKLAEEAAEAGKAVAQEYENAKAEFAKQLAEKDAALAAADAQFAEARTRWEADTLAARKAAEDASAAVKAEFAKQLAEKDAEIASLKAEAKTAEQIAAEKYGSGIPPVAGTPACGKSLKERIEESRGNNEAMSEIARSYSRQEIIAAMKR